MGGNKIPQALKEGFQSFSNCHSLCTSPSHWHFPHEQNQLTKLSTRKGTIIPYIGGRHRKIPSSRSAWETFAQRINLHIHTPITSLEPIQLAGSVTAASQSCSPHRITARSSKDRQDSDTHPNILVSPSSVAPLGR